MSTVMLSCMLHKLLVVFCQDHWQYKCDPTEQIMLTKYSLRGMVMIRELQLMTDYSHKFCLYCRIFSHLQMKLTTFLYKCLNYLTKNENCFEVDFRYLYSLIVSMQDYSMLKEQKLCFTHLNINIQTRYLSN